MRKNQIEVSDRGEDYTIRAEQDGFGFVHLLVAKSDGGMVSLPRMTPFEADMLSKLLQDAAELADNHPALSPSS